MNTHSLEAQLQGATPPTPDPRARLAARRAALEEFDRIHGTAQRKAVGASWWNRRSGLWGGLATACVAFVGVSVIWLMPEDERQVQLPGPIAAETIRLESPASPAPAEAPVPPLQLQLEAPPPAMDVPAAIGAAPVAPAPAQEPQQIVAAQSALTAVAKQEGSVAQAERAQGERGAEFIGNTIANLRGQDPAFGGRTLTLVDGRRLPSTSNQADVVDLNAIPSNLLQRTDVITGGASATYGSGAMAGVDNLALRNQGPVLAAAAPPPAPPAPPPAGVLAQRPVTSITAEEMQRLGIVNVADALTTLVPQNISSYAPALLYVQPRVIPPAGDRFESFEPNPPKRVADEPVSTFSIDVDTASYSFVRRQLTNGVMPPHAAVRAEEMINYFDYDWPAAESRRQPFRPTVTVSDSPWGEGRKLIHIGIKGYELPARQRPDVNLVLLMDVSGSMNSPDKLPLAQRSVAMLLDALKPTDTVAIAVYAGAAGEVLPPTPVREKERILAALNALRAGGSTAGAAGIQLAYQLAQRAYRQGGVNRILLATDGDFNVGISDTSQLKAYVAREREKGVFLSVLGFGQGNYRDEMAQALAQNGNGVAAYIDTLGEARKVLVEEATSALFTIATDVKLQVEFNPATVAEYRLVGYETRALNREDFNNDRIDAGDIGAGHTVTAIYEITPVGSRGRMIDELRYTAEEPAPAPTAGRTRSGEYGFLKIRYKLPGENQSRLLEQPIGVSTGVPARLRNDVQFATAVAGFAQLLQGGRFTGTLAYEDVIGQAQEALGADTQGYRSEFVQLVRQAQQLAAR